MKKLITLLLVCLMAVAFCACAENPYHVSVDIDITENEISDMILYNKISNQINYEYLNSVFTEPDLTNQYEKVVLPEDKNKVENYLLERKLIVEKCKDFDVHLTTDDTTKTALTEYDNIQQDSGNPEYYNVILSVLDKNSVAEADYLKLLEKEAYYKYNSVSLKSYFSKEFFDESKGTTLDEQFDYYTNKLVDEYLR